MARPPWPWVAHAQGLHRALRWTTAEAVLATASENFAAPYLVLFAAAMGAGPLEVSLVAATPLLLTNVLQLPFGRLAQMTRSRKSLWLAGNAVARLVWVPIAVLPWVVRDRAALVAAYVGLLALRSAFAALAVPPWTAMMADLTDRAWRGQYFAMRNVLANLAALGASVAAGYLVEALGYPTGYAAAFAGAWLFGVLSLAAILPVDDPASARPGEQALPGSAPLAPDRGPAPWDWWLGGPRRWRFEAPGFGEFALTSVLWNMAVHLPFGLFPVYFTQHLHGSAQLWGIANGATFLSTVLGQRPWGRMCDRAGQRPVLVGAGLWAALLPLWWALVPGPEWVVLINLVGGYVWAGYNLAAFNLVLEVTPERLRPSYVGLFNTGVGVAAALGPLLGGWLAQRLGIPAVLVLSTVLRLGALWLFARWSGTPVPRFPRPAGGWKHRMLALRRRAGAVGHGPATGLRPSLRGAPVVPAPGSGVQCGQAPKGAAPRL